MDNMETMIHFMTQSIVETFTYSNVSILHYFTQDRRDAIHAIMNSHPEWRFVWHSNDTVFVFKVAQ